MSAYVEAGLTMRTKHAKITDMSTCTETNCQATFLYVAERQYPTLCIEHAGEASREQGWTPENSHD